VADETKDKPEPAKDIHEILRQRRESLDRVRASLETVEGLQRQFEVDSQSARSSNRYPVKTLQSVIAAKVKFISIEPLKISLVLHDNTVTDIEYPSPQTLSEDLRAWCKAATPDELERLDLLSRLGCEGLEKSHGISPPGPGLRGPSYRP
jgi:hypothetical protein